MCDMWGGTSHIFSARSLWRKIIRSGGVRSPNPLPVASGLGNLTREYDTVKFPPYPYMIKGWGGVVCVVRLGKWNSSDTLQPPPRYPLTPLSYPPRNCQQWQNLDFDLEASLKVYVVRLVQTPLKSLNHQSKNIKIFILEIEKTFENQNFSLKDIFVKKTNNTIKSNKCNQCDYASFHAGHLREQWGKAKQMQPVSFCVLWPRFFKETCKEKTPVIQEKRWKLPFIVVSKPSEDYM